MAIKNEVFIFVKNKMHCYRKQTIKVVYHWLKFIEKSALWDSYIVITNNKRITLQMNNWRNNSST